MGKLRPREGITCRDLYGSGLGKVLVEGESGGRGAADQITEDKVEKRVETILPKANFQARSTFQGEREAEL